jgi:predicted DNA-binding protein (MmcQ/YjbR family)
MNVEQIREYCINKPGVTEGFPFDKTTLVFKVMNKMFALTSLDAIPTSINLKCDPERAISLRESNPSVKPGYHMNKQHWNTITVDHHISNALLQELIDHSYNLIVASLTKKLKSELENL